MDQVSIEIPEKLFAPAESLSFSGTYDLGTLVQGADTYTFSVPLDWDIQVSNTGGALLVTGRVSGDAVTACARCLEDAHYDLEGDVEGYFLIPGVDVEVTDEEREEFLVLPEDHVMNVAPLLVAALSVELPLTPLCTDDCKGICPGCGANLNTEPCTCKSGPAGEDNPQPAENPFAVLKNLHLEE